MRTDLEGLVAAEQSYHAAVNTYSSAFTILSYHPAGSVQVALLGANQRGWAAEATTPSLLGRVGGVSGEATKDAEDIGWTTFIRTPSARLRATGPRCRPPRQRAIQA